MLQEIFEDNLIGDPNDLEQIIDGEAEENEDDPVPQEAEDNEENNDNAAENESATADGTRVAPKKKRTVKNPQPKLNPERLKGPRGIAILEKNFEDFKFYGKGYEHVDLNRMMKRLEHWAHRLYPRFQFDDCLEKIEKLGQKKPVQVYVKKIRMGLETGEEPVILQDDDQDEQNDVLQAAYDAPIDAFDELIGHQLQTNIPLTPQQPRPPSPSPSQPPKPPELTAEQKERILRNRLLAEERRLARMKAKREMEKAAQEPTSSVSDVANNEISIDNSISGNNREPSTFIPPVLKISNPNPATLDDENDVNKSVISHEDKTHSTSVSVEENRAVSPLALVEHQSVISKLDDKENNSNTVEEKALGDVPDDLEQIKQSTLGCGDQDENISKLVDVVQDKIESETVNLSSCLTMAVNTQQNLVPDNREHKSGSDVTNEKHNLICVADYAEQNIFAPMTVDEQHNTCSILPDHEQNNQFETVVNNHLDKSVSLLADKDQNRTVSISLDADQSNLNAMLVDTEPDNLSKSIENPQNNVISMLVDNNESTCMSVDVEQNSPTSMSIDIEQSNSIPMSIDNEQSNSANILIENDQNNLVAALGDEETASNEQNIIETVSDVLQQNDNAILDLYDEM